MPRQNDARVTAEEIRQSANVSIPGLRSVQDIALVVNLQHFLSHRLHHDVSCLLVPLVLVGGQHGAMKESSQARLWTQS